MGHIKLLEFYGLRLMVLLTLHDFEGHSKKSHRSPKQKMTEECFLATIISKYEENARPKKISLNFTTLSRIRLLRKTDLINMYLKNFINIFQTKIYT